MSQSIFEHLDYRSAIKDLSKSLRIPYKSLATTARIHTSYFSRVMQDKANFSKEQLFAIGRNLKLTQEQLDYLLLLGEFNNSGDIEHKNFISKKVKNIFEEKKKLSNKFKKSSHQLSSTPSRDEVELYYREAVTAKIHMLLTIDKYSESPNLICRKIFISEQKLQSELQKLEDLKIISRENGRVEVDRYSVHLDEANQASVQNHINWRLQAIQNLSQRRSDPSDYHLSAIFSCDEKTKNDIKELFKDFVAEAQSLVKDCKNTQDAYYIGLDLF